MDKLILVYYIGVGLIDDDDISQYVNEIINKIKSESDIVGEMIIIPTKDIDSRIECINPKYITDSDLIREHRIKMDILHEHLADNIKNLKKEEHGGEITGGK